MQKPLSVMATGRQNKKPLAILEKEWYTPSIVIPASVTAVGTDAFASCASLTIYCEAERQPSGFKPAWNPDNRRVVWGYQG